MEESDSRMPASSSTTRMCGCGGMRKVVGYKLQQMDGVWQRRDEVRSPGSEDIWRSPWQDVTSLRTLWRLSRAKMVSMQKVRLSRRFARMGHPLKRLQPPGRF